METVKEFIVILMSSVSSCMLYSKKHASVGELTGKSFSILDTLLKQSGRFEIVIVEDELIVNKNPLRDIGTHGSTLVKRLRRKGISRIDIVQGITLSELRQFVADIATADKKPLSYPHIKIGVVDIAIDRMTMNIDSADGDFSSVTAELNQKTREGYLRVSPFKKPNVADFQELVMHFIVMIQKEIGILNIMSPVKSAGDSYYTHATNVSVLTIFQAKTLGIQEDSLSDIGLAALLHDIGKLLIPTDQMKQEGGYELKEEGIMLHPLYGAQYLARIDGLTCLAPIVAFEHHLRYDGKGYPHHAIPNYRQHICSQMTAISDYFDILRNTRPEMRALEVKEVLSLMKTKDEGLFNPFLINNFIRSIHLALS
ncbi:MAG: HD domain-containing protein [Thermodesulfovibrionales bacterium]|nr:HD domain-containing protein [Thermodesulfovibrionales bacterium]